MNHNTIKTLYWLIPAALRYSMDHFEKCVKFYNEQGEIHPWDIQRIEKITKFIVDTIKDVNSSTFISCIINDEIDANWFSSKTIIKILLPNRSYVFHFSYGEQQNVIYEVYKK